MMDLKEIIKWFIPCFHILRVRKVKMDVRVTCVCLFLLFNFHPSLSATVNNNLDVYKFNKTKNVDLSMIYENVSDQSEISDSVEKVSSFEDSMIGRTFGRPFKKMAQALIPLVFQIGAASTWAVVAALVGIKTLAVTLIILKLLLVAGAAKLGALFGSKGHHTSGWEAPHPHQKEIHLHIHNGHHEAHDEHTAQTVWNRDGGLVAQESNPANLKALFDPYAGGPQTISTPYGNYVKLEPQNAYTTAFYR